MKKLSTFNKLFLAFCILFIVLVVLKVPREKNDVQAQQQVTLTQDE